MKVVVLTGPESSGKTFLAERLQQRFGQHAEFDADEAEEQAARAKAEGHRKAHHINH